MNILIEGGNLNPSAKEGTTNVALAYVEELEKRGHKVIILTRKLDPIQGKKYRGFEIFKKRRYYRWNSYLELFFILLKIKQENLDLVHIFSKGLRPTIYIKILKKILKKPVIMSLFGDPTYNGRKKIKKESFKIINKILVTSKTIFNVLIRKGVKNSCYMPYGLDNKKFRLKKKTGRNILCLRNVYPDTLKALEEIINKKKIKIIFSAWDREQLEKTEFVKKFSGQVSFLEYVENIKKIFENSALLIDLHKYNKYLECASPPLFILEYMSCELPVISTKSLEMEEVIIHKKNGYLVDNTKEEIIRAVDFCLKNKRILGKNARQTIITKFDWDKIIEQYEKIYLELIEVNKY
jgi:glycosyltransferase involved in cell wall biosynthesis